MMATEMCPPVVELIFEECGYKCVVLFFRMGHRCGYVGVPNWHPCAGMNYDELGALGVECHGGLTYSEGFLRNMLDDDLWWFGFDCARVLFASTNRGTLLQQIAATDRLLSAMTVHNGDADESDHC